MARVACCPLHSKQCPHTRAAVRPTSVQVTAACQQRRTHASSFNRAQQTAGERHTCPCLQSPPHRGAIHPTTQMQMRKYIDMRAHAAHTTVVPELEPSSVAVNMPQAKPEKNANVAAHSSRPHNKTTHSLAASVSHTPHIRQGCCNPGTRHAPSCGASVTGSWRPQLPAQHSPDRKVITRCVLLVPACGLPTPPPAS